MSSEERKSGGQTAIWVALITGLCAVIGTVVTVYPDIIKIITGEPTSTPKVETVNIEGSYLMDNNTGRVIIVSKLSDSRYEIRESTSPWPWEGTATFEDGKLSGIADFKDSCASMKVIGELLNDGRFAIDYQFITEGDCVASTRVDSHFWYPND